MQPRARFPADLSTLLLWPLIPILVITLGVSLFLPLFNWLHARYHPAVRPQPTPTAETRPSPPR